MLNELNEYLNGNMSEDYWYDEALFICQNILKEFSDNNWIDLLQTIPKKDIRWKIRLAECMGDNQSSYEFQCIMKMINTDNNDLFIACIDSLRNLDLSSLDENNRNEIKNQVKLLHEKSSPPVKKVFQDFLHKCD